MHLRKRRNYLSYIGHWRMRHYIFDFGCVPETQSFEIQKYILDIRTALKGAPFLAGYKYAASLVGLPMGIVRNPLSDATDSQKQVIKDNLTRLGLVK